MMCSTLRGLSRRPCVVLHAPATRSMKLCGEKEVLAAAAALCCHLLLRPPSIARAHTHRGRNRHRHAHNTRIRSHVCCLLLHAGAGTKSFSSHLTQNERQKHAYFVQHHEELSAAGNLDSILDNLTDDDVCVLMEAEEEVRARAHTQTHTHTHTHTHKRTQTRTN